MRRGGDRFDLFVTALFVWLCLNSLAIVPFPHPVHRTGRADLPHPTLGQDITWSPTEGHWFFLADSPVLIAHTGTDRDSKRMAIRRAQHHVN